MVRLFTTYAGSELAPSFAPDGKQIAFSWNEKNGPYHIYVKRTDSGTPLRLTNASASDTADPRPSDIEYTCMDSGRTLDSVSVDAAVTAGIWKMSASGGKPERVPASGELGALALTLSPRGDQLAYVQSITDSMRGSLAVPISS